MRNKKNDKLNHPVSIKTKEIRDSGVTLIALIVTIIVLIIIASISIGAISGDKGIIKEANETSSQAQKESIIEKIEADLYTEKVKKGRTMKEQDLKDIINKNDYGTVQEKSGENILVTKDGQYEIKFSEIIGWEK